MTTPIDGAAVPAEASLFEDLAPPSPEQLLQAELARAIKRSQGSPRLRQPNRSQVELRASDLESLLAEDHRARLVWGYVVCQNLSKLFDAVKARGSVAGRAAINPHILFALWLYATLEGVGSGREVARLSQEHDDFLGSKQRYTVIHCVAAVPHRAAAFLDSAQVRAFTPPLPRPYWRPCAACLRSKA